MNFTVHKLYLHKAFFKAKRKTERKKEEREGIKERREQGRERGREVCYKFYMLFFQMSRDISNITFKKYIIVPNKNFL